MIDDHIEPRREGLMPSKIATPTLPNLTQVVTLYTVPAIDDGLFMVGR